ncbi:MAG: ribonuclease III [Spirochaetales bacterium]|nr:ribonuclease III [Spirochaetales bacterium]
MSDHNAPSLSENRKRELFSFQNKAGLSFNDLSLLNNAFIHSSYANEAKGGVKDNERLEFLGDSVLSVVVSEWLYRNLEGDEGDCTRVRSLVVSEDALYEVATSLGLDKLLVMGHGEELTGGRHKKAILADCTEAVIAAIFLDKGFDEARAFVQREIVPIIGKVMENRYRKDYKTLLQEYVQKRWKIVPTYNLVSAMGPEHDQVFYYTVTFHGQTFGPASGKNKKDSEQSVAKVALDAMGIKY